MRIPVRGHVSFTPSRVVNGDRPTTMGSSYFHRGLLGNGRRFLRRLIYQRLAATPMDWNTNVGAVNPKRTLKMVLWSVGGFVLFIVVISALAASDKEKLGDVPVQPTTQATTPKQERVGVGDEGYVKSSSGTANKTLIATSEANFDALVKASVANDTIGIAQLVLEGRLFAVEDGTKVLVIDSTVGARQVRILEGELFGETGWLPMEFVVKNK